jgi:hypothetical protein
MNKNNALKYVQSNNLIGIKRRIRKTDFLKYGWLQSVTEFLHDPGEWRKKLVQYLFERSDRQD